MEIRRRAFISGLVQGVGFRASTIREASRFDKLKGFVRNLGDGRVEAVFQGDREDVCSMLAWCKHGPPSACVSGIEVFEEEPDAGLSSFRLER